MNGLSVIIPSRNAANLLACVGAVCKHEPAARIFVINDGLEQHPALIQPVSYLPGVKPFVFARNCNIGIQAAGGDDVILLNDDALLQSRYGFTAMQRAAAGNPNYGLISATTNLAGNPAQHPRDRSGVRICLQTQGNSVPVVAFVCVLIPRRTIETVGLLDERFVAYGWEDNDYCRRVALAGLRIGIDDDCYVDHAKLSSTFRGDAYAAGSIEDGRKIYLEKWGNV